MKIAVVAGTFDVDTGKWLAAAQTETGKESRSLPVYYGQQHQHPAEL